MKVRENSASITRGQTFDARIVKDDDETTLIATVNSIDVMVLRHAHDKSWWIDTSNIKDDSKFAPVGPFPTPESAWLALQIMRD